MHRVLVLALALGCGKSSAPDAPPLPDECGAYTAIVAKLPSCTKLPQGERDKAQLTYDAWRATIEHLLAAGGADAQAQHRKDAITACVAATKAVADACGF